MWDWDSKNIVARKIQAISDFQSITYTGDPSEWHATTIEGIRNILRLRWTVNDLVFVKLTSISLRKPSRPSPRTPSWD